MVNSSLDISVIICTHTEERWGCLVEAVGSVQRQITPPLEIVLVIDHNHDLLRRSEVHFQGIKVVENAGSKGLADARNSGIRASRGGYVAFLDDDAIAEPDWLAQLMKGYRSSSVVGVGGMIEPIWPRERPNWLPEEFYWAIGCTYRGMPRTTTAVRNLIGCNMSFRRELFEEIGGFRSGLGRVGTRPVGCEETEFCIRARQRRPSDVILYEPKARVRHQITEDRLEGTYFRKRCYGEGISKALVSQSVGMKQGLASERSHALRVLPKGVIRGVADAVLRGDPSGLSRSVAIVAGLTFTTVGYVMGLLSRRTEIEYL